MTAESASAVVQEITSILDSSQEEDQTTDNVNIVTNVLRGVASLLDSANFTVEESVREGERERERQNNLFLVIFIKLLLLTFVTVQLQFAENTVEILDDLSDWPAEVLEEQSAE